MNWFGQRQGEGLEFHLPAVGLAGALTVRGAGAYSLDRRLARCLGPAACGIGRSAASREAGELAPGRLAARSAGAGR
jgi:hypothetical protein